MQKRFFGTVIARHSHIGPVYELLTAYSDSALYCSVELFEELSKHASYGRTRENSLNVKVHLPPSVTPLVTAIRNCGHYDIISKLLTGRETEIYSASQVLKTQRPFDVSEKDLLLGTREWFEESRVSVGDQIAVEALL